jgi:hypothetical protein
MACALVVLSIILSRLGALLAGGLLLVATLVAGSERHDRWQRRRAPRWLLRGARFELTREAVRVRFGSASRRFPLTHLDRIAVLPLDRHRRIGHVVLLERADDADELAIPRPTRTAPLRALLRATWPSTPQAQLFQGAVTLWFVPSPDAVRDRIQRQRAGLPRHVAGPHR